MFDCLARLSPAGGVLASVRFLYCPQGFCLQCTLPRQLNAPFFAFPFPIPLTASSASPVSSTQTMLDYVLSLKGLVFFSHLLAAAFLEKVVSRRPGRLAGARLHSTAPSLIRATKAHTHKQNIEGKGEVLSNKMSTHY